ncbi:hypothetical protein R6Q57_006411 [Mikania cordata]
MPEPTPGGTPQLAKPPDLASANMPQPGFEPKTSHKEVREGFFQVLTVASIQLQVFPACIVKICSASNLQQP